MPAYPLAPATAALTCTIGINIHEPCMFMQTPSNSPPRSRGSTRRSRGRGCPRNRGSTRRSRGRGGASAGRPLELEGGQLGRRPGGCALETVADSASGPLKDELSAVDHIRAVGPDQQAVQLPRDLVGIDALLDVTNHLRPADRTGQALDQVAPVLDDGIPDATGPAVKLCSRGLEKASAREDRSLYI